MTRHLDVSNRVRRPDVPDDGGGSLSSEERQGQDSSTHMGSMQWCPYARVMQAGLALLGLEFCSSARLRWEAGRPYRRLQLARNGNRRVPGPSQGAVAMSPRKGRGPFGGRRTLELVEKAALWVVCMFVPLPRVPPDSKAGMTRWRQGLHSVLARRGLGLAISRARLSNRSNMGWVPAYLLCPDGTDAPARSAQHRRVGDTGSAAAVLLAGEKKVCGYAFVFSTRPWVGAW